MNTYLVTLADRQSGEDQRILVQSACPDGMQEFVNTLPDLKIANPVVIGIRRLRVKRPVRTTLAEAIKAAV